MQDIIAALKPYESYIRIREHEPMAHHTTFRIGGPADLFLDCASGAPLEEIVPIIRGAGVPLYVVGRGSNLLVHDEGVRGVVLCTAECTRLRSRAAPSAPRRVHRCFPSHRALCVRDWAARSLPQASRVLWVVRSL